MKKEKINYWKFLCGFLKPYKIYLLVIIICGIIYSAINAIIPIIESNILAAIGTSLFQQAIRLGIIVLIIMMAVNVLLWIYNVTYSKVYQSIVKNMSYRLSKETLLIETKVFDSHGSGEFINRINRDPARIASLMNNIRNIITYMIADIGVCIYIMVINPLIGLLFFILFAILYVIGVKAAKKKAEWRKKRNEVGDQTSSTLTEMVRGIRDIKLLNLKSLFLNQVDEKLEQEKMIDYQADVVMEKYYRFNNIASEIFLVVVLILGVYFVSHNMLSLANFIVIYMYRSRPRQLVTHCVRLKEVLLEVKIMAQRMYEIIYHTNFPREQFGTQKASKFDGFIEFKNVTFRYTDRDILKDYNMTIHPNETVAIVGKTGAGKSTIFQLLTRNYQVNQGVIQIDGDDIRNFDETSFYNNITMIPQNPYIFHMTIRENLQLVKEDLTDEEMKKVCKIACLDEFIESLPSQYDTMIGEGGVNLSGGERQRLSIARALLKKSEIILFDEATSALDNRTQASITKAIHNLSSEYTVLIIAHRLSTIKECHRIIVIDQGKIVGDGTHQELLKTNPYYKSLYQEELSQD